jgi:MraZ protein
MDLLTGEHKNTLDDKGRVSIPARLREKLPGNVLHLTKGSQGSHHCIWVFTPEEWEKAAARWMKSATSAKRRNDIVHRFIGPMQDVEMDKAGRLMIPPSLRDYAGLQRDCVVVGIGSTMEIWDDEQYRIYSESIDGDFDEEMEDTNPDEVYG